MQESVVNTLNYCKHQMQTNIDIAEVNNEAVDDGRKIRDVSVDVKRIIK